jgi:hypothetical protein
MTFRTRFSEKLSPQTVCTEEERRTKSEFASECDINLIMDRARKTGVDPFAARAAAKKYGDFAQLPDFMQMQDKLIAAHELFAALPATVRKQFDNDPGTFISAADTEEGRAVMKQFGLGMPADANPASPAPPSSAGQADPLSKPRKGHHAPKDRTATFVKDTSEKTDSVNED